MAPSTFASAAAGNHHAPSTTRDAASEWTRRNGATQTFRRASGATTTPTAASHSIDPVTAAAVAAAASSQPARYVPPHRNGTIADTRYSRDQLVELYKANQSSLEEGLHSLFLGGWQPDGANGSSTPWARPDQNRDLQPGAEVCWDGETSATPLALLEMDEEERDLFVTSVNTPIKPANLNKDSQSINAPGGRKSSISASASATTPGAYGLPSPGLARGQHRRRDTSDSYPFPPNQSASTAGFGRDDSRAASPPPSLVRRRTDLKDQNRLDERGEPEEKSTSSPFGSLRRNPTISGSGFGASSSPWATGPQSAGLSPMGTFGNFGIGVAGQGPSSGGTRPGLMAGRTESRFKNLLNKDAEDGVSRDVERKNSVPSLAKSHESEPRLHDLGDLDDVLDEAAEPTPAGSAALTADAEASPEHRPNFRGLGTPGRDGYGSGAFGMTQTPHHQRLGPGGGSEAMSPTDTNPYQSPEPFDLDRNHEEGDGEGSVLQSAHLPGLGGFENDAYPLAGLGGLGAMQNRAVRATGDRSQNSSVGPNRGFANLSGLGQLGGVTGSAAWPVSSGGLGTPGRQTAGLSSNFTTGLFPNSMADLQSQGGLAGLGGSSLLNPAGAFGNSRMSSVFPQGMQDQMRQQDEQDMHDRGGTTPFVGLGDLGRTGDSGFKPPAFVDGQSDQAPESSLSQFGTPAQGSSQAELAQHLAPGQAVVSSASNQPPAPQQRTMVMPDRMRWIYRDPTGQTQGPWSGLEMHDWYKAGFFSPELLVKKFEDPDYEPLAQLIRRIGNSREPFLVPQIGIPHGAPSGSGPNAWAGSGTLAGGTAAPAGGAQPPFASSFPSFGTTLTADQQNALERRKQEEQYLMARQKEHLAQAQMSQRFQMQGGHLPMPSQLHHHSSAHSLHSQPSFGSVNNPIGAGYQANPLQGPSASSNMGHQPGFFDNSFRAPQMGGPGAVGSGIDSLSQIREEDTPSILDRLSLSGGGGRTALSQFGAPGQPFSAQQLSQLSHESHEKQVQQMLHDRARLQQEQAQHDALHGNDDDGGEGDSAQRLIDFEQLQDREQINDNLQSASGRTILPPASHIIQAQQMSASQSSLGSPAQEPIATKEHEPIPKQPSQTLPQPFPAPSTSKTSQTTLASPEPQRPGRPNVAEHLQQQKEPRDHSETPSVESKTAPWATKDPAEAASRGPSLKEIQEMEAKQAAKNEELAAASRRAALQKAMEAEAQAQAAVVTPGLPPASNWATGSPLTPVASSAHTPWVKSATKASGSAAPAKSMAQIQKEEESRKKRLATAALANAHANGVASVSHPAGGKSYANLAGKIGPTVGNPSGHAAGSSIGGAWTMVGAGGKTKNPATPAAPNSATARSVSSGAGALPMLQTGGVKKTPSRTGSTMMSAVAPSSATSISGGHSTGTAQAQEEFKKWAANELRAELSKGIVADDFVSSLTMLPPDMDILTEAVHGASSTLDSRHFAEEFLRRKKLADKGLLDPGAGAGVKGALLGRASPRNGGGAGAGGVGTDGKGSVGAGGGSGWSEVAKKGSMGGAKDSGEVNGGSGSNGLFKVVPAKKKGGKR